MWWRNLLCRLCQWNGRLAVQRIIFFPNSPQGARKCPLWFHNSSLPTFSPGTLVVLILLEFKVKSEKEIVQILIGNLFSGCLLLRGGGKYTNSLVLSWNKNPCLHQQGVLPDFIPLISRLFIDECVFVGSSVLCTLLKTGIWQLVLLKCF